MAKMSVPILVDWESIKDHLAKADIVEVIRCRDCANYRHIDCPFEWTGGRPKPDMYCAWAERKEE